MTVSSARKKQVSLTIATMNDDFATKKSNIGRLKKRADVVMIQEGKRAHYRQRLGDSFGVMQNWKSAARAGSALTWKKDAAKAVGQGQRLGVSPHGRGMLARYISYVDMKVDGKKVRMVSVHRPPHRFRSLWPAFDRNLAAFVKDSKKKGLPVIIGLDANEKNPQGLARRTGLRWHAPSDKSIDGFLASRDVHFIKQRALAKGTSDHHPVLAHVRIDR